MSRMQHARHMALTNEYWAAYIDGMEDRHGIRDNTDHEAEAIEASRIRTEQDAVNRHLEAMTRAVADRSEFHTVTEARARLNARRTPNAADLGAPRIP